METKKIGNRKTRVGTVVSNKMEKTIVVVVERRVLHPVYKKYVKSRSRYMAQDSENTARRNASDLQEQVLAFERNYSPCACFITEYSD